MRNKNMKAVASVIAAVLVVTGCSGLPSQLQSVEEEVADALTEVEEVIEEEPEEEELVLEVDNSEVAPDQEVMTHDDLDSLTTEYEQTEADEEGNTESVHNIEDEDVDLQIVMFGDSIFDSTRDETGIAHLLGENLNADVYNLAIGGTTCAVGWDKFTSLDKWSESDFIGMTYVITGQVPVEQLVLNNVKAFEVMKECDFSETDYFIVEYGTNDFLSYIPLFLNTYQCRWYQNYENAYRIGLKVLQEYYPNAKIIVCTPYYEEFWSADRTRYIGDCNTVNNGYGTLNDYISCTEDVARKMGVTCLNMKNLLGITEKNVNDMTVDGIHPSEPARWTYAGILAEAINQIEDKGYSMMDSQVMAKIKADQEYEKFKAEMEANPEYAAESYKAWVEAQQEAEEADDDIPMVLNDEMKYVVDTEALAARQKAEKEATENGEATDSTDTTDASKTRKEYTTGSEYRGE